MIKIGSLYAGVGGICQGFINAGAKVAWANEIDKKACVTYRANFEHPIFEEDIWKLNPEELDKVEVLAAGFPCQPFSLAGYRKGFGDERGNHFYRILEFVEALGRPKVIFLENVKNLKSHDKGKTYTIIEAAMKANGYSFAAKVLNSREYGNLPQNRERIYMVCFRDDEDGTNRYTEHFEFPKTLKLRKKISDIVDNSVLDSKYFYGEDKYMFEKLQQAIQSRDTVYQWRRQYVRENKKGVCPTLTANMGTGGHNVPLVLTDRGIRKLTPKECFEFQGFPKDFVLPKKISHSRLYKQAGNSVSVPVVERIAVSILKALKKGDKNKKTAPLEAVQNQ